MKKIGEYDLLISGEIIGISLEGEDKSLLWGPVNFSQACTLTEFRKEFHPLDDEVFGAKVFVYESETEQKHSDCIFGLCVPLFIPPAQPISVFSQEESFLTKMVNKGNYKLIFQVIMQEEVEYHFLLIPEDLKFPSIFVANTELVPDIPNQILNGQNLKLC